MKYVATRGGTSATVVEITGDGRPLPRSPIGDQAVGGRRAGSPPPGIYSLLIGGVSYVADVVDRDGTCVVDVDGETYEIARRGADALASSARAAAAVGAGARADARGAPSG